MAEQNQVEPQQVTTEPQQISKEPQQIQKEPQRVTTKNPEKVEAGKRLAESSHKKREVKKTSEIGGQQSYRWSLLLHLLNQERRATARRSATK